MDLTKAKLCAKLSYLTYNDHSIDHFNKLGFQHARFFANKGSQGYVVHNEKEIYVIYRGTEFGEFRDVMRHGMFWPTEGQKQGKVHAGFSAATDEIWWKVNEYLNAEVNKYEMHRNVYFTGHSLGGAMAIISAARSDYIAHVYTYGSPRCGDADYSARIKSRIYRFTNEHDIVPLILPPIGYRHGGIEFRLFNGDIIKVFNTYDSWELQFKIGWYKLKKLQWFRSLWHDHTSYLYVRALENSVPRNFRV